MSGWSQTDIDTEMKIEEEFCAMFESIKSEDESKADIKPATLPAQYVVQRIEARSESSELTQQSNNNVYSALRCRLCAIPYDNMVDIFSSLAATADILEKIEYSLPITVKETDTLPKQICRFCLVGLERCHRFRKSVAEAEELLLAFEKLACIKLEETENKNAFSPLHNAQPGSTEYEDVDGPSETNSDVEMNENESTIIPNDAQTEIRLRSCSVVLSILKTCSKDNSSAENRERSSSNTEDKSADSTPEVLNVERNESENNEESTCDSGVNTGNQVDFTLAHSWKQLLKCNTCAKTFKWKGNLTQHSKIHTNQGLQLHKCDTCAKMFKWKSNLTQHRKMHTNEGLQLHKCDTCAKTFKWKGSLTQHSKIHTGKGLHSCQYCEKAFTTKRIRDEHHRVHTNERPFECPDCKKSFSLRANLKRHAFVHSEERNYRCPLCDKSFKTREDSRKHVKLVHLNIRPWRCALCNKTFGRKLRLRIHLGTCKLRSE